MLNFLGLLLGQTNGIELQISSTQIVGGVGSIFLLLVTLIGWLWSRKLSHIDAELVKLNARTENLPSVFSRLDSLETTMREMRKGNHDFRDNLGATLGEMSTDIAGLKTWKELREREA